jgi:BirA family biotin operon repressor/biotin-[acetyl-CoA-carboxylase] ligase
MQNIQTHSESWNIVELSTVDSTNNYATLLLSQNQIVRNTVIVAWSQMNGRGMQDNAWESEANKNLTLSLVLLPNWLKAENQFYLSKITSLAIVEFLKSYNIEPTIKWPNDIYVGSKKIGGILIENSVMGNDVYSSVIGIGLNMNQKTFHSNAPNPVSLYQLTNKEEDLREALAKLISCFDNLYALLQKGRLNDITERYVAKLYAKGEWRFYKANNNRFEACIVGTTEVGELVLRLRDNSIAKYMFKEISLES